jgi:glycosyltransferase involved in cell wall biosynthesis
MIASDIANLPKHVSHDVSGLLVRVDDAEAWTEAVEALADDAVSEQLGDGALESWRCAP